MGRERGLGGERLSNALNEKSSVMSRGDERARGTLLYFKIPIVYIISSFAFVCNGSEKFGNYQ